MYLHNMVSILNQRGIRVKGETYSDVFLELVEMFAEQKPSQVIAQEQFNSLHNELYDGTNNPETVQAKIATIENWLIPFAFAKWCFCLPRPTELNNELNKDLFYFASTCKNDRHKEDRRVFDKMCQHFLYFFNNVPVAYKPTEPKGFSGWHMYGDI